MTNVRPLSQILLDASNGDWGRWCAKWNVDAVRDVHPSDERAFLDGCYFDASAAMHVWHFFYKQLRIPNPQRLTPDDPALVPFKLLNWWYRDLIGPLFGWKRKDGRRRFDRVYCTTAKKTGKSTVLSGLPLYMLLDGEQEAECYSTAVDRDQAGIIFKKCKNMLGHSPDIGKKLKVQESYKRVIYNKTNSYYEAISSDADSADGANPYLTIVDELHRWGKKREFFETLMYGDIYRAQPIFMMITTRGEDLEGICYEEDQNAQDLMNPETDSYLMNQLSIIHEAGYQRDSNGDFKLDGSGKKILRDWDDPEGWKEANPSIDEGVGSLDKLKQNCEQAKQTPKKRRKFIRLICNRWVSGGDNLYLDQDAWSNCGQFGHVAERPFAKLKTNAWQDLLYGESATLPSHFGESCALALDLSKTIDLTALCAAFRTGDYIDLLWWFWKPADTIKEHEDRDRLPYSDWVADGWIELCPGKNVDYSMIRRRISGKQHRADGTLSSELFAGRLSAKFKILEIGFDPWQSTEIVKQLGDFDGFNMTQFRQGFATMSEPCKEFQRDVLSERIRHGNNPVARIMASKAVEVKDSNGNIKVDKEKSRHRIDGIITAIMANYLIKHPSENVASSFHSMWA